MARIITYKNGSSGKYCQIQLEDGQRVFISVSQEGIRISRMKWGGLFPGATIVDLPFAIVMSDKHEQAWMRLYQDSGGEEYILDQFKNVLLECPSLSAVLDRLREFGSV